MKNLINENIKRGDVIDVRDRRYTVAHIVNRKVIENGAETPLTNVIAVNGLGENVIFDLAEIMRVRGVFV